MINGMGMINGWAKKRHGGKYYQYVLSETRHIRRRYAELDSVYTSEYAHHPKLQRELNKLEKRAIEIISSYGYTEFEAEYGILLYEKDFWVEPQINWNSQFKLDKQRKAAMSKHYKLFQLKLNL